MLQWAKVAATPRADDGSFVRPGARRSGSDSWPWIVREYKPLLAIGRTVRNLQPQVDSDEMVALAQRYCPDRAGWDALTITQQLDIIATEILAKDRMERLGSGMTGGGHVRRDYHSVWQATVRASREKPFHDMDVMIDALRASHYRWRDGWFRTYGDWGQFENVGMPAGDAVVYR